MGQHETRGGIYTALATPFDDRDAIDYPALERLLEQQLRFGIKRFVVCGTTGESPTLSKPEKESLFRFVFDFAQRKGGIELVAGTGTNDTRESVELSKMAESIGYRTLLVVVPYYNKPSQAGLLSHYRKIADSVTGTVILYNVPGRTGISLTAETIVALAAHPRIRAIKEASGKMELLQEIRTGLKSAGRELTLLSGDDETYSQFLAGGGHGVISVASHVCPTAMREIEAARAKGDAVEAERIQAAYLPLFRDLFVEANPTPLKWMLADLGLARNTLRLPLVQVGVDSVAKLRETCSAFRKDSGEYRR